MVGVHNVCIWVVVGVAVGCKYICSCCIASG